MSAPVSVPGGRAVKLHGMLDTGTGVSVMSAEAWRKLGAPILKPWEVPIRMPNDQPIEVPGITEEMYLNIAGLYSPVASIVVESLSEHDFLLGRTFIRDFDVLIDLSKKSTLVREPTRQRNLKRKEVMGSYAQCMKVILDGGTVLKEVTLCRLKLSGAEGQYRNDRQLCVLPIKEERREASCLSAGRTLTLTKDGRVAVPMLNPTDKDIYMRPGQKVACALAVLTELTDAREKAENCSNKGCKICGDKEEFVHVKSISSSDGQESTHSTPSGRSNFPATAEMDKIDLLQDLEELSDRITPEQLERLKAVLETNAVVYVEL